VQLCVCLDGQHPFNFGNLNILLTFHLLFLQHFYLQEGNERTHPTATGRSAVQASLKEWLDYQDGQKILLTTPTVLVGYRLEVYRAEGTTQWYTAVIQSYNHGTKVRRVSTQVDGCDLEKRIHSQ